MKKIVSIMLCMIILSVYTAHTADIEITTSMDPPHWAYLERALLVENARFVDLFTETYINPHTGYFECVEHWGGADGPDDAMENFYNWPLLYVLGAPESTLQEFRFIWEGHIRQYTELGMYYREYIPAFDWEHNGEGYAAFMLLPLADPHDSRTRKRIVRFADFYTGRDMSVHNYDSGSKIIKSILNGSRGARLEATPEYWGARPGQDYFITSGDWTPVKGDVPLNMHATTLAVNAWILTGDSHYRDWALEYLGAWRKRAESNNGIVPSIIGLDGTIGEGWNGEWWGGLMGWDWVFGGWGVLGRGVRAGFTNGYFLSQDARYLDILRRQADIFVKHRTMENGVYRFPNRYNAAQGWHDFSSDPLFGGLMFDIWYMSQNSIDRSRFMENAQMPDPDIPVWRYMYQRGRYEGGDEAGWLNFLQGNDPGYPERVLIDGLKRLHLQSEGIRADTSTPDTRQADTTHRLRISQDAPAGLHSAAAGALVNLTLGGPHPLWCSSPLHCQVRYFDPVLRRPGLPEDVAALVTGFNDSQTTLTLINLSSIEPREIVIQGGAYGEHRIDRVSTSDSVYDIGERSVSVLLSPGAGEEITIERSRYSLQPTFDWPWE